MVIGVERRGCIWGDALHVEDFQVKYGEAMTSRGIAAKMAPCVLVGIVCGCRCEEWCNNE